MAAHVRAPALPVTPEKPAVAGGMEQHRPPTPPLIDSSEELSEEELAREIAEAESSVTFHMEFKELMLKHARVMASMAETLAKYAENAGCDLHILVDRYEDAEKKLRARSKKYLRVRALAAGSLFRRCRALNARLVRRRQSWRLPSLQQRSRSRLQFVMWQFL